ncbi:MAG: hypothetical protein ACTSQS_13645 [Promethearchaeota archaeon]
MKSAIEGPNCIDPKICNGDCCSIKIDVPKVLAKEYIKRGYAEKKDFIRSNVFSFYLRFDEKKGKCFLFDKSINGCLVHNSGFKPPQCWIYPTKFSNPENIELKCKKTGGWKIIDYVKAKEAEKLLQKYISLCEIEANKEFLNIKKRLLENSLSNGTPKSLNLIQKLRKIAPSRLAGFKDTWDSIKILNAEGYSLQTKRFCNYYNNRCELFNDNFLKCNSICDEVATGLTIFLKNHLYNFVKINGPDVDGIYPLYKLYNYVKKENIM